MARTEPPPVPDPTFEPQGFVVLVSSADRIHFLDWGEPDSAPDVAGPGILLVHGLSGTAWSWAPVARRLRGARRVIAMDLRGHGLSDAPTEGYDVATQAADVVAVAEGSGLLAGPSDRVVLAGHGFGAVVATWGAAALGERCAGLVLVDGGFETLATADADLDEYLRALDEPPEVLRSMRAYLADRASWDPATWDADQERAARAAVVETAAGRVVPAVRPHAREAAARAFFAHRPGRALAALRIPVTILVAGTVAESDGRAARIVALDDLVAGLAADGRDVRTTRFPGGGHNLPRYRPAELAAAILVADRPATIPR